VCGQRYQWAILIVASHADFPFFDRYLLLTSVESTGEALMILSDKDDGIFISPHLEAEHTGDVGSKRKETPT
jgi:hypothetical protein